MPLSDLIDVDYPKAGLPPGTLVYIGDKRTDTGKITIVNYDKGRYSERRAKNAKEAIKAKRKKGITWIHVDGLHNLRIIEEIGRGFGLHPMLLEDLVNTEQRPKLDDYDDHLFIVLKSLEYNPRKKEITDEHVALVLGKNYVLSFQEKKPNIFKGVKESIRNKRGKIRKMGADYLAYILMDSIVDRYFSALDGIGEVIGDVEEKLANGAGQKTLRIIQKLKREMLYVRKKVWPLREVTNKLQRRETDLIKRSTEIYLKDLNDHVVQSIDTTDTFTSMLANMLDVYLSSISNKTNEVMKVLTIFTAVFIPMTFITGLYGMNFRFMPELAHPFGYFGALGAMGVIAIILLVFFKRKKWI
ncbi:MAG: magnesium/cobalt transporter CorA [Candidatus Micrarchaeota archaeon]